MKRYDRISSAVWFFFAIFICIESLRLPLGSFRDPGPGFLPLLVGFILGILSVVSFLQARRGDSEGSQEPWYPRERWKNLISILVALFAYAVVLNILGFLVSTFLLLTSLFRGGLEPQRWIWAIGGSAIASICCYVVFEVWLRTQLPIGIFGF